ncbi:LacI family DNA-binding transcriptional regulator [Catenulispora rubra]|uniref:LacI family DNA-binding transcriptional regulator n=1 Tax=Catenulispora rubra TaxID=280293 RepID=UPI0018922931|nr:LacI family DNA-binding transcriptional regulator [Catenulispora rubra]
MKRPTISDIAERAGVSTGLVSYALNGSGRVAESTRAKILAVADEMGWRPSAAARGLAVAKAQAIGLVLARSASTLGVEPFFMKFIAGLEGELSTRRVALLLQVVEDHEAALEAVRAWWAEQRIDGVIVTDLWTTDARVSALETLRVPAVLVGPPRPDSGLPAVWSDDAAAITETIEYLVGLGHRRIARVAGHSVFEHTRVRTAAFQAAARRHGLPYAPVLDTDYTVEAGAKATEELLSVSQALRPTAIVYDNDVMALSGIATARRLEVPVPQQLSIVAGDDSQLCEMVFPPLTALSRDIQDYGAASARTLLALIEGTGPGSVQSATAHLVVRGSTAAAA